MAHGGSSTRSSSRVTCSVLQQSSGSSRSSRSSSSSSSSSSSGSSRVESRTSSLVRLPAAVLELRGRLQQQQQQQQRQQQQQQQAPAGAAAAGLQQDTAASVQCQLKLYVWQHMAAGLAGSIN
uniref:Uncharacterized protein n=1 Tax=Tetradesmus obliquus TaxID=3088 RepID=A0A383WDT4_TETOB